MLLNRLKFWLIVGLLISNLAVGGLSLYFLHSVNTRYAELLDRSVPVINNLRTLTRELSAVQRLARRIVDPENEADWAALSPQMDKNSNAAEVHAHEVGALELFKNTPHASTIDRLGREYDDKVDQFLSLVQAKKLSEANRYNNEVLRPCYDNYQIVLDAAADYVQRQGNSLREQYAEQSKMFGGLLLAFASWPVLAAMLGVLVMGLLIVALLVAVFAPGLTWRKHSEPPSA